MAHDFKELIEISQAIDEGLVSRSELRSHILEKSLTVYAAVLPLLEYAM